MPSSYTPSLRLTLPATGELSGQWGNTVNTGITELLDASVAGTTSISTWGGAGVAYTLSNNSGAADEARRMFIVATGAPGEAKNVICPAVSKFYVMRNDTTGGFALTLKTPSGSGISVPAGQYKLLYCNGTDVVEMFNSAGALTLSGALTVGGTTTLAGNPTLSAGTANGVTYLNASKVLTSGSALTFDGTNFGLGTNTPAAVGTTLAIHNSADSVLRLTNTTTGQSATNGFKLQANGTDAYLVNYSNGFMAFYTNASEQMRLTSTGLGIGTISPAYKLDVDGGPVRFTRSSKYLLINPNYNAANTNVDFEINTGMAFTFTQGVTERMRLDSSGNLGLGVTPSAWDSASKAFQISTHAGVATYTSGTNQQALLLNNAYLSATGYRYLTNNFATYYQQQASAGTHAWFTAPSGTAGNAISFTQAMTLDASGNLLVGTTSASGLTAAGRIVGLFNGSSSSIIGLQYGGTGSYYLQADSTAAYLWNSANTPTVFGTNNTERARITSGGDLLVGTTDGSTGNKLTIAGSMAFINGASIPQINYYSSASTIEYVNRDSGGSKTFSWYYQASAAGSPATLSTSGVWTNASDARGKENISEIHYGLDTVMALQPRQYDVKSDGSHAIGFVAQEILPIVPELVHVTRRTESDEFYGLDYGSMTAVLVKAIQEQQALITALTARVAALEAQP